MGIFSFLKDIISPVGDAIDKLTTTDEERLEQGNKTLELKNEFAKMEHAITAKMIDYETKLLTSQTDIIKAEAQGGSWIQKSWRPITMLGFLLIVLLDSFGIAQLDADRVESVYGLLKIGLGGYVVGRSAEKIAPYLKSNKKAVG